MPKKYVQREPEFECHQYNGDLKEIADWAPVTKEDGKVFLETPMGKIEIQIGTWIMKDIYDLFHPMSDHFFKKGHKEKT